MANLTDADKVLRNDVGKSIASKLDDIADAIVAQGGGAHSLGQLSDVDIDTQTLAEGQAIVYNSTTQKFENGEVSTVAALDDLTDVSITSAQKGDSLRNDGNGNWVNEPTTIEMTSVEWEAIADKQAWRNAHKNTYLVITDAPNLNATAQNISYDGGADTVWNKIEGIKTALSDLPAEIRCGGGNYSGLKGGGHANRVTVPITFSTPMSGTQYAVFIVVSDAYTDYPYIQGYCFGGSRTANGFTATILSMSSDTVTEVSGSFYWVAVRYK